MSTALAPLKVHLRLGIAPPVSVVLDRSELSDLDAVPVEQFIDAALVKVDRATTNGFVPEMKATLQDSQSVVELAHGGALSVVSHKSPMPSLGWADLDEIEIGVSKPNQGG